METEMASMAQFQLAALIHRSSRAHQSCFIKTQNNNTMRRKHSVHHALREQQKLLSSIYKYQKKHNPVSIHTHIKINVKNR